jgi:hypothetical protein
MTFKDRLISIDACDPAVAWVGEQTLDQAWATCHRGDWMVWLLQESGTASKRALAGLGAEFAELALPIFEKQYPGDPRVRDCIEACKRYAVDETMADAELGVFRCNAACAADHAVCAAVFYAFCAAAAADHAAAVLQKCADIVRAKYPTPPKLAALFEEKLACA